MADNIKQQEKNGNFVQFYRDNMQAVAKLAGKTLRLFKFSCLSVSIWMDIMPLWRPIKSLWTILEKAELLAPML